MVYNEIGTLIEFDFWSLNSLQGLPTVYGDSFTQNIHLR